MAALTSLGNHSPHLRRAFVGGALAGGTAAALGFSILHRGKGVKDLMRHALPAGGALYDAVRSPVAYRDAPRDGRSWPKQVSGPASSSATSFPRVSSRGDFWPQLTPRERLDLTGAGTTVRFDAGRFIYRQGDPGRDILILRSGEVEIRCDRGMGPQIIARRHAGDIVGERSAFAPRPRSASVVATTPVEALKVPTGEFVRFVEEHPAVMRKLEDGMYLRLTESMSPEPFAYRQHLCQVLMADICAFSSAHRSDTDRAAIMSVLYEALRLGSDKAGLPLLDFHTEDRGDGTFWVIPPTVAADSSLDVLFDVVEQRLRQHNDTASPGRRMAVRLAYNVAVALQTEYGTMVGDGINLTARLLDAPAFKNRMADDRAVMGVIVSEFVHSTVISQSVLREQYAPVEVHVKERHTTAWITVR
jgi:CRP-like cAMP-binding protein